VVDHAELLTKTDLDARLDQFESQLENDLTALSGVIDRRLRRQT
jgi:hypothetical protein